MTRVQKSLGLLVERATDELEDRQRAAGAAEDNWITAQLIPAQPRVVHGPGSPVRAVAAAMLVGVAATLTLSMLVDEAVRRRERERLVASPAPCAPPIGSRSVREPTAVGVASKAD